MISVTAVGDIWGQRTNSCREKSVVDWFTWSLACVNRGVWVMAAADAGWGGGPASSCRYDGVHADGRAGHRVDPSPASTIVRVGDH